VKTEASKGSKCLSNTCNCLKLTTQSTCPEDHSSYFKCYEILNSHDLLRTILDDVTFHFVLCFLFSLIKDDISYAQIAVSQKKNQTIITYKFLGFLVSECS